MTYPKRFFPRCRSATRLPRCDRETSHYGDSDGPTGPRRRAIFVAKLERYSVRGARLVRLHERGPRNARDAQLASRSVWFPDLCGGPSMAIAFSTSAITVTTPVVRQSLATENRLFSEPQTCVLVRGCRGPLPASAGHSPFTRKSSRSACNSTIETTVIRYWNG
jgi:hypothetical protein